MLNRPLRIATLFMAMAAATPTQAKDHTRPPAPHQPEQHGVLSKFVHHYFWTLPTYAIGTGARFAEKHLDAYRSQLEADDARAQTHKPKAAAAKPK